MSHPYKAAITAPTTAKSAAPTLTSAAAFTLPVFVAELLDAALELVVVVASAVVPSDSPLASVVLSLRGKAQEYNTDLRT